MQPERPFQPSGATALRSAFLMRRISMAAKEFTLAGTPFTQPGGVREVTGEELEQRRAAMMEAIARRAYERFEQRGGEHGYHIEDWLEAERELTRPLPWALVEEPDGFRLIAEVPGFTADQVKLYAAGSLLMLEAHMQSDSRLAGLGHAQIGRDVVQFIPVPEGVSVSRATLDVEHGILQVQMPLEGARRPPHRVSGEMGRARKTAGPEAAATPEPAKAKTTRRRTTAKPKGPKA